jgi:hypothetical protein
MTTKPEKDPIFVFDKTGKRGKEAPPHLFRWEDLESLTDDNMSEITSKLYSLLLNLTHGAKFDLLINTLLDQLLQSVPSPPVFLARTEDGGFLIDWIDHDTYRFIQASSAAEAVAIYRELPTA